jgi:two-component system chemotaxis response regulator CheY
MNADNSTLTGRVVDIGQCDPDHASIRRLAESLGLSVVRAYTAADARKLVAEPGVVLALVNRIFDADGASGMDCIEELVALTQSASFPNPRMKVMLVSNYPEYQSQAVALGALPGFGKAALREPDTAELIRKALG